MSRTNVLIALLVAVALGAIAVFLTIGPGKGWMSGGGGSGGGQTEVVGVGERLFTDLRPSSVSRLVVAHNDGRTHELQRRDGGWSLMILGVSEDDTEPVWWPIAGERISSMLRILAEARAVAQAESGAFDVLNMDGTVINIDIDDPADTRAMLFLSDRTIGGVGTALVTRGDSSRVASVEASLNDVFVRPGPSGWRDSRLLSSLDGAPTRISVEGPSGRVELRRREGQWRVHEPAGGAPAEDQAVQRLLGALTSMQISDYLDAGAPAALAGDGAPVCTVVLRSESSAGAGDGSESSGSLTMSFGPVTDAGNSTRAVRLESGRLGGKPTVLAGPAAVEDWPGDPANFVRRAALLLPATDIGMLVIDEVDSAGASLTGSASPALRVARRLERWVQWDGPNMPERVLTDGEADGVREVVRFLREHPADAIVLTRPTPGYQRIGRLVVGSVGASPLAEFELGTLDGVVPVLRDGTVWRIYAASSVPETLLRAMAGLASSAAGGSGANEPPGGSDGSGSQRPTVVDGGGAEPDK